MLFKEVGLLSSSKRS